MINENVSSIEKDDDDTPSVKMAWKNIFILYIIR